MPALLTFFVILVSGLVFSEIFKRLHLPYVTALIIAGILIGPYVLDLIQIDETVNFIGSIGIVFLMFMAGSEIKTTSFRKMKKEIFIICLFNALIPFITGFGIGWFFRYDFFTSLILGTVFVSSSIAVVIPSMETNKIIDTKVGKTIISVTVIEDICSLILLAFILQSFNQKTLIPLPVYIPTIVLLVLALKIFIPEIKKMYYSRKKGKDLFESELRFVFVVLLASILLFETIGMHAMIAGFIIGIILGNSIKDKIEEKIRTVSYGIFIPTFFLIMGMQTDLTVFSSERSVLLTYLIILGLITTKIVSGWIGGRLSKFSSSESLLIGISTVPQLSTTLATAFAALEFGLLNQEIITSLIILSIITTFAVPLGIKVIVSSRRFPIKR
jgi:Kef-type K+ transport system membrane component KefB